MEHDLDFRLPHPRSGFDRRRRDRLHALQCQSVSARRARRGPRHRHDRAAHLVLLERAQRFLRRDREVSRGARSCGRISCATSSAARDPRSHDAALPHADGRLDADRAGAREQRRARHAAGAGGGARRHAIAAYQRQRRSARAADGRIRASWRCARSRSSATKAASPTSWIRSRARITSSRSPTRLDRARRDAHRRSGRTRRQRRSDRERLDASAHRAIRRIARNRRSSAATAVVVGVNAFAEPGAAGPHMPICKRSIPRSNASRSRASPRTAPSAMRAAVDGAPRGRARRRRRHGEPDAAFRRSGRRRRDARRDLRRAARDLRTPRRHGVARVSAERLDDRSRRDRRRRPRSDDRALHRNARLRRTLPRNRRRPGHRGRRHPHGRFRHRTLASARHGLRDRALSRRCGDEACITSRIASRDIVGRTRAPARRGRAPHRRGAAPRRARQYDRVPASQEHRGRPDRTLPTAGRLRSDVTGRPAARAFLRRISALASSSPCRWHWSS